MSELLQSAQHPDADQLAAFADHALPAHEREQTLTHLATCAVCRQLVFLSQVEEPVEVVQPVAVKKPWFAGWNLLWAATAALAGLVVLSVHLRHIAPGGSVEPTVAIATEPLPIPAAPPLAPAVPSQAIVPAAKTAPRVVTKVPEVVAPAAAAAGTSLNGGLQQQGMAIQAQDQSSLGLVRNRDKKSSVPLGGPMVSQQQQMLGAAGAPVAQKYVQAPIVLTQAAPPPSAPKPAATMGGMGIARATPTAPQVAPPVAVTLGTTMRAAAAAAPAPAERKAAPQPAVPSAAQTVEVGSLSDMAASSGISLDAAPVSASVLPELPSGKATVSRVSNGSRTVALDTTGALFVSKDGGGHWSAVKAQWPGRAVRVGLTAAAPEATGRDRYTLAARSERGMSIAHHAVADGTHAQIAGSVTDASGAVIPGATIRVKNAAGTDVSSVRADRNGSFATAALDPGTYVVQIAAPGFVGFAQTLELQAGDRAWLGAVLRVAAESETVTVTAAQNQADVAKPKPEPFTLTTDTGVTWTSKDGQKWRRR
jgi:hypothetical protein